MTKFNEETTKELIKKYSNGIPLKQCASAVGIDRSTVYLWMNKGKKSKKGKYHQFYLDMQRARAKFIAYHHKKINESNDWRASQYLLQVTDPEHYIVKKDINIESKSKVDYSSDNVFDKELFEKILEEYD